MNLLQKKRQFVTSKLTFKSKDKISSVICKDNDKMKENIYDKNKNQNIIQLQEGDDEKKIFKEFISEKELKMGLYPQKSYNKSSKIVPLPKEYKVYKKNKLTNFEKLHKKKIEKEKNKLSNEMKMEKWNFDSNYEKYQKLLTSLPEFNEMPRISGA